jgi:hypothetical protein
MLQTMGCTNKQCEHHWYCKNYEFMPIDLENNIDLNTYCETHDYCLLDKDDVLKSLYDAGEYFRKVLGVTKEDVDRVLREMGEG